MNHRNLKWFGFAGFLISFFTGIFASAAAFLSPFNHSPADWVWAGIFFILIAGFGYLFMSGRYRLLLYSCFIAVFIILLVVVIFSDNGPALFAAVWLTLIAAGIGKKVLDWLSLSFDQHMGERILFATVLGFGALAVMITLLGSAHSLQVFAPQKIARFLNLLHPIPVFLLLIALTILFVPGLYRSLKPRILYSYHLLRENQQDIHLRWPAFVITLFSLCAIGPFLWSLSPTIRVDSIIYHLAAPSVYIQNHGIIQVSEPIQFYWAHYGEMIFMLGLLVSGQPLPSLLSFLSGLLLAGITYSAGTRIGGPRLGIISALVFYSLPILIDSGTPYNDFWAALFSMGMIVALVNWWFERKTGLIVVAGIMSGLALGTKYSALIAIIPAIIFLMGGCLVQRRLSLSSLSSIFAFVGLTLLLFIPWGIYNWAWMRNPFYPYLSEVFHTAGSDTISIPIASRIIPRIVQNYLLLPWNLTVNGGLYYIENTGAILGGLMLLALPWKFLNPKALGETATRSIKVAGGFLLVAGILFLPFSDRVRYLMPVIPLVCILVAANISIIWNDFQKLPEQKLVFTVGTCAILIYLFATRLVLTSCGWQIPERFPYGVAFGLEKPPAYLSRTLNAYDALQFIDQQGDGIHKIASFGNESRLYTLSQVYSVYYSQVLPEIMARADTPDQLAKLFQQNGFDYILLDQESIRKFPEFYYFPVINDEFLSRFTRLEFARNNVYAYHFYPGGVPPIADLYGVNVLKNGNLTNQTEMGQPAEWVVQGNPSLDQQDLQSGTGQRSIGVTAADILYTTVDAKAGELYTLAENLRGDGSSAQGGRLQIMWLDRNHQQLRVSIDVIPVSSEWDWQTMSVTAPQGAVYARVYLSAHENTRVWIKSVCFAEGEKCIP